MSLPRVFLLLMVVSSPTLVAQTERARAEVVVVSGTAPPYMEAAKAAAKQLEAQGYHVHSVKEADIAMWDPVKSPACAVIVIGSQAANLVRTKAPDLLMSYCMVGDTKAAGFEGHASVVGVTTAVPLAPQFELIRRALPTVHRIGMLHRSTARGLRPAEVEAALPASLTLHAVDLAKTESVATAIDQLLADKVDIVWTAPDPTVFDSATVRTLLLRALRANTPVFGFSDSFVRAGALLGINVDPARQGAQASDLLLARLRDGQNPDGTMPLPPDFTVGVNLTVANHLQLTLPDAVVKEAKLVVEAR